MTFTNEGTWDRAVRFVVGLALAYVAWTMWPGTASVVVGIISIVALMTGLVGWCPAYTVFGFSTKRKTHA